MKKINETLKKLCSLMTVSGFEKQAKEEIFKLAEPIFDEAYSDSFGNFVFVKKSGLPNAPKMMVDAHFDRIGMMVTGIKEGGFLSVINVGGIDTRILPSSEVTVYGREKVYGIISSVPPHLRKSADVKGLPTIEELYIDTGLSMDKLSEIVSLGDPVMVRADYLELLNDNVMSGSLDDKACVAAAFDMAERADKDKLKFDVYVIVSAQEETGKCGAALATYKIKPDIALITDVTFGTMEGDKEFVSIDCGKGPSIDFSALADRRLSRKIAELLKDSDIPYTVGACPSRTGTNNDLVSVAGEGIRTAIVSLPLKSMHTQNEIVNLRDVRSLADILLLVAYTDKEVLI